MRSERCSEVRSFNDHMCLTLSSNLSILKLEELRFVI